MKNASCFFLETKWTSFDQESNLLIFNICFLFQNLPYQMEVLSLDQHETELFSAIYNEELHKVHALLQKEDINLDSKNENGETLLQYAVLHQKEKIVELLLEKGAKIEGENSDELTPLQVAVLSEQFSITKILLKHGANVEAKNKLGLSPLHVAICDGNNSLVKILLEYGADANSPSNNGLFPLISTICKKNFGLSELLLQNGARPDVKSRSGPALLHAMVGDDKKSLDMLLRYGASLKIKDVYERTPLEVALDTTEHSVHKLGFLKAISYHQY